MKYSKNSLSRFVPILLVIGITIVAVAAVIAIGRAIMGGGSNTETPAGQVDRARAALLSSDSSRAVRLTVRGNIVGDEDFRSYQVTISPDSRDMTTFEGYLGDVIETVDFENNFVAYEELIFALDKRKMMDSRALSEDQNDLRGVCANGKLYEFEVLVNGETLQKLWTSDCGGAKGSALAEVSEILDMFLKQIPDGNKIARGIGLGHQDTLFRL